MKNKIKKIFLWAVGCGFLLFAVLIVHIVYMVKKRGPLPNATLQLARVDFLQQLDSSAAAGLEYKVRNVKGVKAVYFNKKDNILIYGYDNRISNAQAVYETAIKDVGFKSVRHIVQAKELEGGCPAMGGNSFYAKLTNVIYKVVN